MKTKKLKWRDNVTAFGKEKGLFEIIADVDELKQYYCIRNYKYHGDPIEPDKIYLFLNNDSIECKSVEDAQEKAQEHFVKKIVETYFE